MGIMNPFKFGVDIYSDNDDSMEDIIMRAREGAQRVPISQVEYDQTRERLGQAILALSKGKVA